MLIDGPAVLTPNPSDTFLPCQSFCVGTFFSIAFTPDCEPGRRLLPKCEDDRHEPAFHRKLRAWSRQRRAPERSPPHQGRVQRPPSARATAPPREKKSRDSPPPGNAKRKTKPRSNP